VCKVCKVRCWPTCRTARGHGNSRSVWRVQGAEETCGVRSPLLWRLPQEFPYVLAKWQILSEEVQKPLFNDVRQEPLTE
jgi:hypothetical protein